MLQDTIAVQPLAWFLYQMYHSRSKAKRFLCGGANHECMEDVLALAGGWNLVNMKEILP
jgi:hypothetical protein